MKDYATLAAEREFLAARMAAQNGWELAHARDFIDWSASSHESGVSLIRAGQRWLPSLNWTEHTLHGGR